MANSGLALLLLAGALATALGGVWLVLASSSRRAELAERGTVEPERGGWRELARGLDRRFQRTGLGGALAQRLATAGVGFGPLAYLGVAALAALAGYAFGRALLTPLFAVLVAAGCVAGTWAWVEREREKRRQALIAQLPEIARVLSNGASAGLSMAAAVELAGRELQDPAGAEMRRLVQEQRLGRSLEDALEALTQRVPSREVAVLMTTLIIQQRAGGDVVRALQDIAGTLDARKELLREVRTLMSGAVFTSYLVALIGVGTLFLLDLISPGVLDELLSAPLGIAVFAVSGTLYAIGFVLIRRVTRVET
jgi:tight adherence protein B